MLLSPPPDVVVLDSSTLVVDADVTSTPCVELVLLDVDPLLLLLVDSALLPVDEPTEASMLPLAPDASNPHASTSPPSTRTLFCIASERSPTRVRQEAPPQNDALADV